MNKKRDILSLVLAIAVIVLLNFVGSFVFHRFDLTSEKRYTLSDATKKLLGNLNDVVYVKVYLDGEFPSGFKRLRDETREMLDEFRVYSNDNIEYEFINPNENTDKKERDEVFRQLVTKGLQPTNLEVKEEGGVSQQIIFPGAIVSHKGKETPWQLLKTSAGQSPEMQLNNSIQALEYEFASSIRNLTTAIKPQIGIIEGHGELDTLSVKDIKDALSEFYYVRQIKINEQLKALDGLKAIIIAKPDTAFSEKDKFVIDQYVMKGGKVLWAIDALNTSVDTLRKTSRTIAIPNELNLDDILFKYGARLNPNMILDLQSSAIPVNKSLVGQPPRFELMPWIFAPLLVSKSNHPIVKNLDLIKAEYASSIDTIDVKGIKKTILLQSSKYSKTLNAPVRVDLRMVNMKIDENRFQDSYRPVALLLEGAFESVYKNRVPPQIASDSAIAFKDKGIETKMIVLSDGDMIRNEIQYSAGRAMPLGYDIYTKQTYGNKNFILNCVNYLCDDSGLISVRARELTLRLLDKKKLKNERTKWQIINTALPILTIIVFGMLYAFVRRRKYAR
jgi:ABC-2 type transport system permease protein